MSDHKNRDNVTPLFGGGRDSGHKVNENELETPDTPETKSPVRPVPLPRRNGAPTILDLMQGGARLPEQQAAPDPHADEKGEVYNGLHIDFIGHRRVYYAISLILIALGIIVSAVFGVKLDIQFKGGAIIEYSYTGTVDTAAAAALANKTISNADFTAQIEKVSATGEQILVLQTTKALTSDNQTALFTALSGQFTKNALAKYEARDVSPVMGQRFLLASLGAVGLASLLIVLYIWARFRKIGGLPAGVTAFIALVHDVLIAFVAVTLLRIAISGEFIAVVLTILGYSINDTIVVYDRIRENRRLFGRSVHFREIVNRSINQTFTRSVNTTLVTFLAIAAVCVFSVIFHLDSIRSFALPMMVGVVTGCYSTICIAGPLWVTWVEHKEKKDPKYSARMLAD